MLIRVKKIESISFTCDVFCFSAHSFSILPQQGRPASPTQIILEIPPGFQPLLPTTLVILSRRRRSCPSSKTNHSTMKHPPTQHVSPVVILSECEESAQAAKRTVRPLDSLPPNTYPPCHSERMRRICPTRARSLYLPNRRFLPEHDDPLASIKVSMFVISKKIWLCVQRQSPKLTESGREHYPQQYDLVAPVKLLCQMLKVRTLGSVGFSCSCFAPYGIHNDVIAQASIYKFQDSLQFVLIWLFAFHP